MTTTLTSRDYTIRAVCGSSPTIYIVCWKEEPIARTDDITDAYMAMRDHQRANS